MWHFGSWLSSNHILDILRRKNRLNIGNFRFYKIAGKFGGAVFRLQIREWLLENFRTGSNCVQELTTRAVTQNSRQELSLRSSSCCFLDPGRKSLLLLPLQLHHIIHKGGWRWTLGISTTLPARGMLPIGAGKLPLFLFSIQIFLQVHLIYGMYFACRTLVFRVCSFSVSAINKRRNRANCILCRIQWKMKMQSPLFKKQGVGEVPLKVLKYKDFSFLGLLDLSWCFYFLFNVVLSKGKLK